MNESLRLGHVAGVRVGINWSVLAIFALVAFGLAAGRFPAQFPGLPAGVYAVVGLAAAVVFFLSLLAHEVAHAVLAKRNGLEVEGITLWLFGGVAQLGGEPPDPGADLRIAGVGPLTSLVLGGVFAVLAFLIDLVGVPGIVVSAFAWLAAINVALAVFNLVPAAPLDGGRILRGFLWKRSGDRIRASVTAARAGRVFGLVLIGLGLFELVVTAGFGGLWLMFIGWFLLNAARAEEQHAIVRGALADVRVREVMSADPTTAPGSMSVQDFIEDYMFRYRHSAFPLTDERGGPAGLVTLNRVKGLPSGERSGTLVRDVACPADEVPTAHPDEPLSDLLTRMSGCADGRALILEDGRIVGIVSPSDVARRLERTQLRNRDDAAHV